MPVEQSHISWTDSTWSPVTGCDRVSEGCQHCYALTMAARLKAAGNRRYQRDGNPRTSGPGFGVTLHEDVLEVPLHWRKPRRIFVNSMSDLFHPEVPDAFIARVFAVMTVARDHQFQILTKRPRRMQRLLSDSGFRGLVASSVDAEWNPPLWTDPRANGAWPLPSVWLGVSVETQKWADLRIPLLHETPAAHRFLSCEPLLGRIELGRHLRCPACAESGWTGRCDRGVEWVIVGGESGPGYRPMDLEWLRLIAVRCDQEGVPVHVKQDSGLRPGRRGRIGDLWDRKAVPA
jgi:protein gp37